MPVSFTPPSLQASVIIPTHNRSVLLARTLEALTGQTAPAGVFEVIVVADGCSDDTAQVAHRFTGRLQLRLIEQPGEGPAAARNRGAEQAQGALLVFLDDDIEALPQLVETHLRLQAGQENLVLIGYLPPLLEGQRGFFRAELLAWWEIMFQKMRRPGYRFAYTDLLSGNFSVREGFFVQAGKFDPAFRVHEDYELGVRLHRSGARFAFSDDAAGWHLESTTLERSLQRKFEEGISDTRLGSLYPELRPTFLMARLVRYSLLPSRFLQRLAFSWPGAGDLLARFFQSILGFLDRIRALRLWQRLLYGLMGYWYWRGVAEELGTLSELKKYLSLEGRGGIAPWSILELDLAQGIDQAESQIEAQRPDGLSLYFNRQPVGFVPPQPGGEKLRGAHLRPLLASDFSVQMLKALATEGALEYPEVAEQVIELCDEALQKHIRASFDEA